jgi:hypothetical protein
MRLLDRRTLKRLFGVLLCAAATGVVVAPPAQPSPGGGSQLKIVSIQVDRVGPGGTAVLRATVANYGPSTTVSALGATVRLPLKVLAVGTFFPSNCHWDLASRQVSCSFKAGLPLLRTATLQIPVRLDRSVLPGQRLTGGMVTATSPDNPSGPFSRAFTISVD